MTSTEAHWDTVYATKDPTEVSWYEEAPETSLELIAEADLPSGASIVDVGGGASSLGAALSRQGFDVTVADISARALEEAADDGVLVEKVIADVRSHDFGRGFDLWHDRALFHFMVDEDDRSAYLAALRRALRPGGHLVIATFGPDGPDVCSGLPVRRYGEADLGSRLGDGFSLLSSRTVEHRTPSGGTQQFLYAHFRRR